MGRRDTVRYRGRVIVRCTCDRGWWPEGDGRQVRRYTWYVVERHGTGIPYAEEHCAHYQTLRHARGAIRAAVSSRDHAEWAEDHEAELVGRRATARLLDRYDWAQLYPIVDTDGLITGVSSMQSEADLDLIYCDLDAATGRPIRLGGGDAVMLEADAIRLFGDPEVRRERRYEGVEDIEDD